MAKEPSQIIKRRFISRTLESGLLIIAIALGVGAAASGFSLYFHTKEVGEILLDSTQYKEIVVTSRGNVADMDIPATKTADQEIILTTNDLKAGEITPEVLFSYIVTPLRIRLEGDSLASFGPGPDDGSSMEKQSRDASNDSRQDNPENRQRDRENDNSIIITDIDDIYGEEVTSQFFDAMNFKASHGSFFTNNDYTSSEKYIILGSKLAKSLDSESPETLTGKKLPAMDGLYTIVGILEETGTYYDSKFLCPKKEISQDSKFNFRGPKGDSQLRFYVSDVTMLNETALQLETWFKNIYGESQIVVSNPRNEATNTLKRNQGISILILFLSLAGLFIASVNVSNILMSRAIRMKKHVGILKALGASKRSIIKLFSWEAMVVTLAGSVLGTGLAIPLSIGMEKSMGLNGVSWLYIALGVLISALLTFIFSVVPARLNSKVNPAEAMRN